LAVREANLPSNAASRCFLVTHDAAKSLGAATAQAQANELRVVVNWFE